MITLTPYTFLTDEIGEEWLKHFKDFNLVSHLENIEKTLSTHSSTIYPEPEDALSAFKLCPLENLKAVIIGQDPYHNPGQAHGLAFSVLPPTPIPPSLRNIFVEIEQSLKFANLSTDLSPWAKQGVLMLNTALTVTENAPGSHAKLWEPFTMDLIRSLAYANKPITWVLWGNHAKAFEKYIIKGPLNSILKTSHPSPLSVRRGFSGSDIFAKINETLRAQTLKPIDWRTDVNEGGGDEAGDA